jgi:hypothetical protein
MAIAIHGPTTPRNKAPASAKRGAAVPRAPVQKVDGLFVAALDGGKTVVGEAVGVGIVAAPHRHSWILGELPVEVLIEERVHLGRFCAPVVWASERRLDQARQSETGGRCNENRK